VSRELVSSNQEDRYDSSAMRSQHNNGRRDDINKAKRACTCFVGNLPFASLESEIVAFMSLAGNVVDFKLIFDADKGRSKGYGFCRYADEHEMACAVRNLNGEKFSDGHVTRAICVRVSGDSGGMACDNENTNELPFGSVPVLLKPYIITHTKKHLKVLPSDVKESTELVGVLAQFKKDNIFQYNDILEANPHIRVYLSMYEIQASLKHYKLSCPSSGL